MKKNLLILLLSLIFLTPDVFAETGDILYSNCVNAGSCTGAGSSIGWVRTVESTGCYSGSCLKVTGTSNPHDGYTHGGSNDLPISTSAANGKSEITVVYYTKYHQMMDDITDANFKSFRPYVGGGNYYFATINGFRLSGAVARDFYASFNYGIVTPTAIFQVQDYEDTYEGNGDACDDLGNGTYNCNPAGRLLGRILSPAQPIGTTWVKLRQWIKIPSTTSASDGEAKLWVDEELAFHMTGIGMDGTQTTFSDFTWYPSSEAGEAFEQWMDEMVILEGYVPPGGDTTAPTLAEVTPVSTPSTDTTPEVTFSTDEDCSYVVGGSCSGSGSATIGNNTVGLGTLSPDTYSDCTIVCTDSAENASDALSLTSFEITVIAVPIVSGMGLSGIKPQ
jgi:hypothetical protein